MLRLILSEYTHIRFILTVIHSFAVSKNFSLALKCDAYPGRLNQVLVLINREDTFYDQCSEICGLLHNSMFIVIQSVSIEKFLLFLQEQ